MFRTLAFALAFAAYAAPALAEDFTFVVPVEVWNLPPEITGMNVSCSTQVLPGGTVRARMIGSGRVSLPVHGSYVGDVTIAFNASSTEDPHLANGYTCSIDAFTAGTGAGSQVWHSSLPDRFIPLAPGAVYRPFVADVRLP